MQGTVTLLKALIGNVKLDNQKLIFAHNWDAEQSDYIWYWKNCRNQIQTTIVSQRYAWSKITLFPPKDIQIDFIDSFLQ